MVLKQKSEMRKSLVSYSCAQTLISYDRYVSELLYIHSKVMIVDDRRVIVSTSKLTCTSGW
jgi:phosphatidylserine/phosphatidylglycerophosphate/cardiolipin synthase-like enzyme